MKSNKNTTPDKVTKKSIEKLMLFFYVKIKGKVKAKFKIANYFFVVIFIFVSKFCNDLPIRYNKGYKYFSQKKAYNLRL